MYTIADDNRAIAPDLLPNIFEIFAANGDIAKSNYCS